MVDPLFKSPSFDGVLPSLVFLQVFLSEPIKAKMINCSSDKLRQSPALFIIAY